MTENTEGDAALGRRPKSRVRISPPLVGVIACLALIVSSMAGVASVDQSLDSNLAEQPVIDETTAVVVSDDELCLVATSVAPRLTELGA
jgi:hypothetical protein